MDILVRDSQPPYFNTTPRATPGKPEVRKYRIRGVIDDVEIGELRRERADQLRHALQRHF